MGVRYVNRMIWASIPGFPFWDLSHRFYSKAARQYLERKVWVWARLVKPFPGPAQTLSPAWPPHTNPYCGPPNQVVFARGRNTILCNWKEICRGYKLSATIYVQHYNTLSVHVHRGWGMARTLTKKKTGLHSLKLLYNNMTIYKTEFKMPTRREVTNWGSSLRGRNIW